MVVAPGWEVDYPASSALIPSGQFIRLIPQARVGEGPPPSGTMLLQFRSGTGTLLAILPGFIGVMLVAENWVLNVNYLPVQGWALLTPDNPYYRPCTSGCGLTCCPPYGRPTPRKG